MKVAKPNADVLVTVRQIRPRGTPKEGFKPQVKKIQLYETTVDEAATVIEKAIYAEAKESKPADDTAQAQKMPPVAPQKPGIKK